MITITDMNGNPLQNGAMTISIDKPTGTNGEKAYVTVTPTTKGTGGVEFFYLRSVLTGATAHGYLPIIISQQ